MIKGSDFDRQRTPLASSLQDKLCSPLNIFKINCLDFLLLKLGTTRPRIHIRDLFSAIRSLMDAP
jgi:hypothetical protein